MDPNQTWRDLCDALAADFNSIALDHAGNLLEWIRKGGFNPINCSHSGAVIHSSTVPPWRIKWTTRRKKESLTL
jgi:hypothetical protein